MREGGSEGGEGGREGKGRSKRGEEQKRQERGRVMQQVPRAGGVTNKNKGRG